MEETPTVDPSSSSVHRPSPPPPPLPDFAPQPLLPPPSPPPPPLAYTSNTRLYVDSKEAKNRQALALASAVAAEAAVVAAHAAAEVVRLTTPSTHETEESKEETAAIKIQNAYRCYKVYKQIINSYYYEGLSLILSVFIGETHSSCAARNGQTQKFASRKIRQKTNERDA